MKSSLLRRPKGERGRRRRRWPRRLAAVTLTALSLVATHAAPAGAYTIEYYGPSTLLITSARLHANKVDATMHVALYETGEYQWWIEAESDGVNSKSFSMWCEIEFNTIYHSFRMDTGDMDLPPRRKNGGKGTFYGPIREDVALRDHFYDLGTDFAVHFHLEYRSVV